MKNWEKEFTNQFQGYVKPTHWQTLLVEIGSLIRTQRQEAREEGWQVGYKQGKEDH